MEQEKELTSQESLELISRMISNAKQTYHDTGRSSLLWGGIISFCSLVTFANHYIHWDALGLVWILTIFAVIPQVMISVQEKKQRRYKAHDEDFMSGIWISFAIAMFLLSFVMGWLKIDFLSSIYMVVYGIPTFTVGYARRFRPMLIGGIACWVFAILALFVPELYAQLFIAASAQLAWFIPGLILRSRYLKAKEKHV